MRASFWQGKKRTQKPLRCPLGACQPRHALRAWSCPERSPNPGVPTSVRLCARQQQRPHYCPCRKRNSPRPLFEQGERQRTGGAGGRRGGAKTRTALSCLWLGLAEVFKYPCPICNCAEQQGRQWPHHGQPSARWPRWLAVVVFDVWREEAGAGMLRNAPEGGCHKGAPWLRLQHQWAPDPDPCGSDGWCSLSPVCVRLLWPPPCHF